MASEVLDRPGFAPADADLVRLSEGYPSWLLDRRRSALSSHHAQGIPTVKHEEWKYTSLRGWSEVAFNAPVRVTVDSDAIAPYLHGLEDAIRLVFVNGFFDQGLSTLDSVAGLEVSTLADADPAVLEKHLGAYAKVEEFTFVALNTAAFASGTFVRVRRNAVIERPIHIVHLTVASDSPQASYPRTLVIAESGSQAKVVETFATVGDHPGFSNAVTEVYVESNAHLEMVKAQLETETSFHIAATEAKVERDGTFLTYNVTLGGALTRNDINVYLNGENGHVRMDGVYALTGDQHCDNHTRLDHAMPHCDSFEVYKGVLDGKSTGVFNGKIFVHLDAQKTDAKQTNQALLLSPTATINTKPQLEIFADDVKCTHGATVGQLRSDALFYLRARGIPAAKARALLVYAFAAEVIEKITLDPLRNDLERRLFEKLGTEV